MKSWTVKHPLGHCDFLISGNSLEEAIEINFKKIASQSDLGNAAGYKILDATIQYNPNILGGHGGVEINIVHIGLPLAHKKVEDSPKTKTVWIYADKNDLPLGGKIEI